MSTAIMGGEVKNARLTVFLGIIGAVYFFGKPKKSAANFAKNIGTEETVEQN